MVFRLFHLLLALPSVNVVNCIAYPCFFCTRAALTEDKRASGAAPAGGIALILGWTSMAFLRR